MTNVTADTLTRPRSIPDERSEESLSSEIDVVGSAQQVTKFLNRIPRKFRNCEYFVSDESDTLFRQDAIALESAAYEGEGYGDRAEAENLFDNQFHGAQEHGPITYLAARDPTGELLGFVSIFENTGPYLFRECAQSVEDHQGGDNRDIHPNTPRFIVSKIARHPRLMRPIRKAHYPHRILTAAIVCALSNKSPSGILIETQVQPASQRMLRPEAVRAFFPGYRVLYPPNLYTDDGRYELNNVPESKVPAVPMLMHYPHTRVSDLRHIVNAIFKPRRKK